MPSLHHSELSPSPSWRQMSHPGAAPLLVGLHSLGLSTSPQTLNQCLPEVLAHCRGSANANGVDEQTSKSFCAVVPLSPSCHLLCPHHVSFLSLSLVSPISSHLPFHPGVSPETTGPAIPIREKPRLTLEGVNLPGPPVGHVKE